MTPINALLGVRPDHSQKPRQLEINSPNGNHPFLISGSNVELARPRILSDNRVAGLGKVSIQASNKEQIRQWIAEQRASGQKIEVENWQDGFGYFATPFKINLNLGGAEGLRAIAYIALTFLAHHFPKTARQAQLAPFKQFVLNGSGTQPVWWDFSTIATGVPKNQFDFGHRVVISASKQRQEACAQISLFSTLEFAVLFGSLDIEKDCTIVVDIDPHADHPPNDVREIRIDSACLQVQRPVSFSSNLAETIDSGEGQARFGRLIGKIMAWQQETVVQEIFAEISTVAQSRFDERRQRIRELINARGQNVLNLITSIVKDLRRTFEADAALKNLTPALDILVSEDTHSVTGLTPTARATLALAVNALTDQISRDLDSEDLDIERLRSLICGSEGLRIVANIIVQPLCMALGLKENLP